MLNVQRTDSTEEPSKQQQTNRNESGEQKCIIIVLRIFDSARTSNSTKAKMSQEVGKNRGEKNYKRSQTQQTLHHYLSFFLYLQKTNTIQAKPRRAHHMHGWTVVSSLPTAETRYDKKNFKKDDRVTLSMYKGNNNKQLCVAWEVKCSHHNEDAQKNFPRQKQTAGKTKHLTVLFFPTALVPSVTKKKKKRDKFSALCTITMCLWHEVFTMQWQRKCAD